MQITTQEYEGLKAEIERLRAALEGMVLEVAPGDDSDRWKRHNAAYEEAKRVLLPYQQNGGQGGAQTD